MSDHPLNEIFHPGSIAVIGSSGNPNTSGFQFTDALFKYGFKGQIYPVNPKHSEVLGLKAYPSVQDIPEPVDYVISCVPAPLVLNLMKGCVQKGVKAVHLFTARFSETGRREAANLEQEILRTARSGGVRIIGPNCMGLFHPGHGVSFSDAMPHESGTAGLISQSGQMAEEIVRYSALRGVYFSKAVSYGNALDLNECDYLDYFTQDPDTSVILMYLEGVRDGRKFYSTLRRATAVKPVVILKGGRGKSGTRAASSHTASMAGSHKVLDALIAQAGSLSAASPEELMDLAAAFYFLPPFKGVRVGVAGGGGGSSVLAADLCEEAGLEVVPLPDEIREELKNKGSAIWDWIGNPADMSIRDRDEFVPGYIMRMMAAHENFDLLLAIMSDPHHERQRDMSVDEYLDQYKLNEQNGKPLLAVVPDKSLGEDEFDHWSWKVVCGIRTRLIQAGIPFYPTIDRAASAAGKMAGYFRARE